MKTKSFLLIIFITILILLIPSISFSQGIGNFSLNSNPLPDINFAYINNTAFLQGNMGVAGATILNLIPGFGLGSLSQGDTNLASALFVMDSVGFLYLFLSYVGRDDEVISLVNMCFSLWLLIPSKIFGIIGPIVKETKPLWPAIVMNLIPGIGFGSLYQNDKIGGLIQIGIAGNGVMTWLIYSFFYAIDKLSNNVERPVADFFLYFIPIATFVLERIYGVIRAVQYYNNKDYENYDDSNSDNNNNNENLPDWIWEPSLGISQNGDFVLGMGLRF
jgi:hypothetical protein